MYIYVRMYILNFIFYYTHHRTIMIIMIIIFIIIIIIKNSMYIYVSYPIYTPRL